MGHKMLIIDVFFLCKRKQAHSFNDTHAVCSMIIWLYGLLFA